MAKIIYDRNDRALQDRMLSWLEKQQGGGQIRFSELDDIGDLMHGRPVTELKRIHLLYCAHLAKGSDELQEWLNRMILPEAYQAGAERRARPLFGAKMWLK